MVFFVTGIIFDLAQVFFILLFVLPHSGDIIASSESIGGLALLIFVVWMKILLDLAQSLLLLASISTITLISR